MMALAMPLKTDSMTLRNWSDALGLLPQPAWSASMLIDCKMNLDHLGELIGPEATHDDARHPAAIAGSSWSVN
jgi:hypothetical protein